VQSPILKIPTQNHSADSPGLVVSDALDLQAINTVPGGVRVLVATARQQPGAKGYDEQQSAVRGLLMKLLEAFFPKPQAGWEVTRADNGAPLLHNPSIDCPVHASLSHSGAWVMAAVARGARVGVDIERHKPGRRTKAMAEFLGWPAAYGAPEEFVRQWTLWESLAKCGGLGIMRSSMPGFEELRGFSGQNRLMTSSQWHARSFSYPGFEARLVIDCPGKVEWVERPLDPGGFPG